MTGDISEKLQSILGDEEAMKKLKTLADSMGIGGEEEKVSDSNKAEENNGTTYIKGKKHSSDDHINLLLALRPFLSDDRKEMADRIIRLLKVLKMTDAGKLLRG